MKELKVEAKKELAGQLLELAIKRQLELDSESKAIKTSTWKSAAKEISKPHFRRIMGKDWLDANKTEYGFYYDLTKQQVQLVDDKIENFNKGVRILEDLKEEFQGTSYLFLNGSS
jgi:hypothetical protein